MITNYARRIGVIKGAFKNKDFIFAREMEFKFNEETRSVVYGTQLCVVLKSGHSGK